MGRLLEIAALPAHSDCCVKVKLQFSRLLNEGIELARILEFRIAIQEQGGVVGGGLAVVMQFFQKIYQVMDMLRVKELGMQSVMEALNTFVTVQIRRTTLNRHAFRITCDGSVFSIARRYCCIAVS